MHLNPTENWQQIELTSDQVWKCSEGIVALYCNGETAPTDETIPFTLSMGESIPFRSGKTVHYKRAKGTENKATTIQRIET